MANLVQKSSQKFAQYFLSVLSIIVLNFKIFYYMKKYFFVLFCGGGDGAVLGVGPRILRKIWQRKTNVLYLGFQGFCQIINLSDMDKPIIFQYDSMFVKHIEAKFSHNLLIYFQSR